MSITIDVPDTMEQELATAWGVGHDELPRRVLEAVATEGYWQGVLSHRQIGELLHLDYWETEALLKHRGAFLPYTVEDVEKDRRNLRAALTR